MSRPRLECEFDLANIRIYASRGSSLKEIARLVGCSEDTLRRRMKDSPDIRAAYEQGRESANLQVRETAFQLATSGKCPAMTMFWLKTQCQWRETDRDKSQEAEEQPLLVPAMTRQQALKMVEEIRKRQESLIGA